MVPKRIYLLQHSHTDIGYTDRQEKITRHHIDYLKQAIEISELIQRKSRPQWEGFCWTCESFWVVEYFLENEDVLWIERFKQAVKCGHIDISGNYLNMTELVDTDLLVKKIEKASKYCQNIQVPINSAMTADINGYSWGYPQALLDGGITNLFTCIHTHHGMYPLRKRQTPFYWETQKGERLLVWSGDHYHRGNRLGIEPMIMWQIKDVNCYELERLYEGDIEKAYHQTEEYLEFLNSEGYNYDFVPLMTSGFQTDNAPPNPYLMDYIQLWNRLYGDTVQLEMISLNGFFKVLTEMNLELPVYRGDMPDWWSDGVGSTPGQTKLFREAQRRLKMVKSLDIENRVVSNKKIEEIEYNLLMYGEHTWGYSSSVSEPWNTMVNTLGYRKDLFATMAHLQVSNAMDDLLQSRGEAGIFAGRPLYFKVINPSNQKVQDVAKLYIDFWELPLLKNGFKIICEQTGESVEYQVEEVARGTEVSILVSLEAKEEKTFLIIGTKDAGGSNQLYYPMWSEDQVKDCVYNNEEKNANPFFVAQNKVQTSFVAIEWSSERGIYSWIDRETGNEMLRADSECGAFTPIYERTPNKKGLSVTKHRNDLGRNRKGINVQRSVGCLSNVSVVSKGSLFVKVELGYELEGSSNCSLLLVFYKDLKRVDVSFRLNKDSVLEPENIYLCLPFTSGQDEELWIEKSGAILRPRVDQIPGTCIDFYCIQEGMVFSGVNGGVAICTPDVPLIHMGSIDYKPICLHEDGIKRKDDYQLYSWVMNNFWETNFKASLAGFYEFQYSVLWDESFADYHQGIQSCIATNNGLLSFRLKQHTM